MVTTVIGAVICFIPMLDPYTQPPSGQPVSCDVFVVGGGINGAGIARDLAGRGCDVVLVEKDDLAQHTSSSSTKLIHGGLRYLEFYEFGLVRKALKEREVLLRSAPHIMRPLRFVMPHNPSMRPAWMIRVGLFIYDHLARREILPGSTGIDLRRHEAGPPLKPEFVRGFAYSDGWVDDARLVLLNAIDAREHGAKIFTRRRCIEARRAASGWMLRTLGADGRELLFQARALVNAAGPWAEGFLRQTAVPAGNEQLTRRSLRLVKGSHIVVPKLFDHACAYLFQNPDQRIIFAIPYEERFTLIGTTDVEIAELPEAARITADEVDYLCAQASRYFRQSITPQDVVWSYAGIRPLLDDRASAALAVTRDYQLEADSAAAPLLTVWGGKITTYRKLAEEAADAVLHELHENRPGWTRGAFLPGGELIQGVAKGRRPDEDFRDFLEAQRQCYPWLEARHLERLAHAYGSRIARVMHGAARRAQLGAEVAPGLFEAELHYLLEQEWAKSAEDILWRRSKLGLHFSAEEIAAVRAWVARQLGGAEAVTRVHNEAAIGS